jgi:hypothetical protein
MWETCGPNESRARLRNSSVSSEPEWCQISASEEAVSLTGFESFCGDADTGNANAIDSYYAYTRELLLLGNWEALEEHPILGRLLLLGVASGVEQYFRTLLSEVIGLCPIARESAASQMIALGSVGYYGDRHALGLFENTSFASKGEIRKKTQNVLGVPIPDKSSVAKAIELFETVCCLRHASVHARGELSPGNIRELGLSPTNRKAVRIGYAQFQVVAQVSHNLVRAYNRFLFKALLERWIARGLFSVDWDHDKKLFNPLFQAFKSRRDAVGPRNGYQAYRKLRPAIVKRISEAVTGTEG